MIDPLGMVVGLRYVDGVLQMCKINTEGNPVWQDVPKRQQASTVADAQDEVDE